MIPLILTTENQPHLQMKNSSWLLFPTKLLPSCSKHNCGCEKAVAQPVLFRQLTASQAGCPPGTTGWAVMASLQGGAPGKLGFSVFSELGSFLSDNLSSFWVTSLVQCPLKWTWFPFITQGVSLRISLVVSLARILMKLGCKPSTHAPSICLHRI